MNMLLAIAFLGMVTQVESRLYDVLSTEYRFVSLSVTDVIQRYFTPGRTLLVLLPGTSKVTRDSVAKTQTDEDFKAVDVVLEELNDEMRWPLHMFRICSPPVEVLSDTEEIYGSYVIFLMSERGDDAMGNLMTQLELLKDNLLLNSRAQFLFIVISRTNDMPSDLAFRILNLSWKYMIGNAILMMQSSSYSDQKGSNDVTSNIKANVPVVNLFTFSPYSREQNCSDVKNIMLLDKSYLNVKGEFIRNSDLVLKRSITNLYGCPVKVITYDLPPTVVDISKDGNANCTGLEINILLFILEQMNTTAVFSIIPSTNKTLSSIFGEFLDGLDSGFADIAIGALPLCDIFTGSADATVSYFQTPIQWLVPCPKPVHRWQAVFAVFPSSVWLYILLSFVSVVTVMRLLASYSENFNYTSLQYCLLNIWAVALEVSVHKMPQTFRIRGLFLMWIWVSFALCTVFGAFFTTFLVNPGFERKIKTLDELLDSGIPYGYTQHYERVISDRTMKISQSTCVNHYTCLENAIKYGNFATISDAFHVDYYRTKLSWHDSHLPVCTLEEDVFLKVSIVMYLTKGHPLLERINKVTRSMVEAGMMVKWKNDFMHTSRIHSVSFYGSDFANESDDLDSKYVVFTLLHLQSALFVLLFGYIISVSTVAVELIYCKFYAHHSV
jgi:hypothetical protein